MNGAHRLVRALEREGVRTIFGYPGGAIMPVYDALVGSKIRHILTRHEQGAALAAIGYARMTGRAGACLATSGPGATNLVTGIADAFMDSVPLVAFTGQVPRPMMGTDAFQEVDIFGMTMPIVKHSFLLRNASDIEDVVRTAFRIATQGRPGPVLVDLPKDVMAAPAPAQTASPFPERPPAITSRAGGPAGDSHWLDVLDIGRSLLASAQRPVLYVGGGVANGCAVAELRRFVNTTRMPTVQTLKALGTLPGDHECSLGMLGMHGLKAANLAVQESDLLVVAGARFDDRVTGKVATFAPHAKVIHMDVDHAEVGKVRKADVALLGDIGAALDALAMRLQIQPWRERCRAAARKHAWNYDPPVKTIYAPRLLRDLSHRAGENVVITCDVGQHQMWVAQHCRFRHPRQHLSSGGLGTMGFGLPAAVGAQLGDPEARVICCSGDGSIMMNIQELATVKRYDLPIKVILFDNHALGMVRQWQEIFFQSRYSEVDLSDNPDFVRVAESFGIPGVRVERPEQVDGMIERVLADDGPLFVHVLIDPAANVWPLVPPGASNDEMLEGAHL